MRRRIHGSLLASVVLWMASGVPCWAVGGTPLRFEINAATGGFELRFQPRVLNPAATGTDAKIVPTYRLRRSLDLENWEEIVFVEGGLNIPTPEQVLKNNPERPNQAEFWLLMEEFDLSRRDLRTFKLEGADLRNVDLTRSNLEAMNLRGANLEGTRVSGASLAGADLRGANLRSTTITSNQISGALLLDTRMPDGTFRADDPDAEMLALELGGELLAPPELYLQIRTDLKLIRARYPEVAFIHHRLRWKPGEVLLRRDSTVGLEHVLKDLGGYTISRISPGWNWSVLTFAHRYNSVVLSRLIPWSEPNWMIGDGDDIRCELSTRKYTFSHGFGDCEAGCIFRQNWIFQISADSEVVLLPSTGE